MELISYRVAKFDYRTPHPYVDENGDMQVRFNENETPVKIPPTTFLFYVETDENGELISAKGVDAANAFLMYSIIHYEKKDVSTYSRALTTYFDFLLANDMKWNDMPARTNQRPTYRFKAYLKDLYKEGKLEASTANTYINCIVNFYKHYLIKGYHFKHEPFRYEQIELMIQSGGTSMKPTHIIDVHTTDLRLGIKKQEQEIPNHLRALYDDELQHLNHILTKDQRVVKRMIGDHAEIEKLSIEFVLVFLLMRYAGFRNTEVMTMNREIVFEPSAEEMQKGMIDITIGPRFGIETKFDKERVIEIPSLLMLMLYEYTKSVRYIKRSSKFRLNNPDSKWTYLFISNRGQQYGEKTLNARWSDIRRTLEVRMDRKFNHKPHNLRATYAVYRLKSLLKSGVETDDALIFIQNKLGHSQLSTTLKYLKQAEDHVSAFEKSEQIYEYLFDLYDLKLEF